VRASSAVKGVISPVGISGVEFEDADESYPVAVTVARHLGAKFIIAVDVSAIAGTTPTGASKKQRRRDIDRALRIKPEAQQADFIMQPDLGYGASPRRPYFLQALRTGEAYARTKLPELQAKLKQAGIDSRSH
jgi:NTE family protein